MLFRNSARYSKGLCGEGIYWFIAAKPWFQVRTVLGKSYNWIQEEKAYFKACVYWRFNHFCELSSSFTKYTKITELTSFLWQLLDRIRVTHNGTCIFLWQFNHCKLVIKQNISRDSPLIGDLYLSCPVAKYCKLRKSMQHTCKTVDWHTVPVGKSICDVYLLRKF